MRSALVHEAVVVVQCRAGDAVIDSAPAAPAAWAAAGEAQRLVAGVQLVKEAECLLSGSPAQLDADADRRMALHHLLHLHCKRHLPGLAPLLYLGSARTQQISGPNTNTPTQLAFCLVLCYIARGLLSWSWHAS